MGEFSAVRLRKHVQQELGRGGGEQQQQQQQKKKQQQEGHSDDHDQGFVLGSGFAEVRLTATHKGSL
jgi:hypothetical protein